MISDLVSWLSVGVIAFLAARDDWRSLSIPNHHAIVLLLAFPLVALSPAHIYFIPGLFAALLMLVVGLLFYSTKMIGAGDVKLASALSLYIGFSAWSRFMLVTAIAGGFLSLLAVHWRKHPEKIPAWCTPESWPGLIRKQQTKKIPYGLAIAIAGVLMLGFRLFGRYFTAF